MKKRKLEFETTEINGGITKGWGGIKSYQKRPDSYDQEDKSKIRTYTTAWLENGDGIHKWY
jgi:hypothetical protein